jgi:hypothetical protein
MTYDCEPNGRSVSPAGCRDGRRHNATVKLRGWETS